MYNFFTQDYGNEKRTLAQMERHQREMSKNVRKVFKVARLSVGIQFLVKETCNIWQNALPHRIYVRNQDSLFGIWAFLLCLTPFSESTRNIFREHYPKTKNYGTKDDYNQALRPH